MAPMLTLLRISDRMSQGGPGRCLDVDSKFDAKEES